MKKENQTGMVSADKMTLCAFASFKLDAHRKEFDFHEE